MRRSRSTARDVALFTAVCLLWFGVVYTVCWWITQWPTP